MKSIAVGATAIAVGSTTAAAAAAGAPAPFELPKVGYAYDALEPHIDARTMEIHHTRHHQAFITNLNNTLKDRGALAKKSAEEMVRDLEALPAEIRTTLRNNAGGHLNHAHFWRAIGPKAGGAPKGELARALDATFGSFDKFKAEFTAAAGGRFGSGWAWLAWRQGKLVVESTANQDTPLMTGGVPLLGLDVWEHAYYLKYQNRRADYVAAFWSVVNWDFVAANYAARG